MNSKESFGFSTESGIPTFYYHSTASKQLSLLFWLGHNFDRPLIDTTPLLKLRLSIRSHQIDPSNQNVQMCAIWMSEKRPKQVLSLS
jgi:hypothetical protein